MKTLISIGAAIMAIAILVGIGASLATNTETTAQTSAATMTASTASPATETPTESARPSPTASPPPPAPALSANMRTATLWVHLINGPIGVQAYGLIGQDRDAYGFDLFVIAGSRSESYCVPDPIFSEVTFEFGCASIDVDHRQVTNMKAIMDGWRLDCARQSKSTANESVWACLAR